jgi:hypothetical protein
VDEVLLEDLNDEPSELYVNLPKAIDLNRYYQKEASQEESVHMPEQLDWSMVNEFNA